MRAHKGIPVSNLYYMLAYAFEFVDETRFEDVAAEEFDNALDLLAALLDAGVTRQIKQGLFREYIPMRDDLQALRGKINMRGAISNRMARKPRIACEFDELSENNSYNQVIKTVCSLIVRSDDVSRRTKDSIKKSMLYFSNVSFVEPSSIQWSAFVRTVRLSGDCSTLRR